MLVLHSVSCLGIVEPGAAEELAFSPDHVEAHITKSFGAIQQAPGCPRARSPQPPSAFLWSGVSEAWCLRRTVALRQGCLG